MFRNDKEAHEHSLLTLNHLYGYDDFMASIHTVADLGCGSGLDIEWWASRTTRDDAKKPLNISCQGIDLHTSLPAAKTYKNITYQRADFEGELACLENGFDILWCHDSFQYCINPLQTLANWRKISAANGMLMLVVPQTTNTYQRDLDFNQPDGCFYHHTMVSLIHMLATAGWDCKSGFFKKEPNDDWLYAIAYNSTQPAMNPKTTRWYDLVEAKLLPDSADKSVLARGFLHQKDLVLPWLNKSLNFVGN